MIPRIKEITNSIIKLQKRQDIVMQLSRDVVRLSGETITALHSKNTRKSSSSIKKLRGMVSRLRKVEKGFEYYSAQAHQEFVEALVLHSILARNRIPSHTQLGESPVNYLLGVMDVVGELKREAFEELSSNNIAKAKSYYNTMRGIYDSTMHMRFANSIMPAFRKKQDVARIQIESTASELVRARG